MSDKQEQMPAKQENGVSEKWEWYWRTDENGHADCGVFYEKQKGHAYSVCRAPKYISKEQWEKIAPLIASAPVLAAQRAELVEALKDAIIEIDNLRSALDNSGISILATDTRPKARAALRAGGGE